MKINVCNMKIYISYLQSRISVIILAIRALIQKDKFAT